MLVIVTIYDVAREAGVSMATVSRVVNGNPNVKPSTRKKVQNVIDRLGYRPNAVARGLASKKTTTVGVIIPDIASIFFAELARGTEDIATMYDYNIILGNSDSNYEKEIHLINTFLEKQVDGLVFMGGKITEKHLAEFQSSPVPIVLAATINEEKALPSVNIDYEAASFDATMAFIERGHENIAFVSGPFEDPINGQLKLSGYRKAMAQAGFKVKDGFVVTGDYSYDSGLQAIQDFLKLRERPTAIFVGTDEMALGVIHGIQDANLSVPDQIEVIGFDNTKLATMVRPTLSTVVMPMYDIGAVSMRLLTKLMNKEEVEDQTVLLPHRIEFRNSTINPPK